MTKYRISRNKAEQTATLKIGNHSLATGSVTELVSKAREMAEQNVGRAEIAVKDGNKHQRWIYDRIISGENLLTSV